MAEEINEIIDLEDLNLEEIKKYADLSRRDLRALILHLLYIMSAHDYEDSLVSVVDMINASCDFDIPKDGDAFVITKKILDMRDSLDSELVPFLKKWKLERLGTCTKLILWMGMWELKDSDTPATIVINEAVELAKSFSEKDAHRFVNGILDQYAKKVRGTSVESESSEAI